MTFNNDSSPVRKADRWYLSVISGVLSIDWRGVNIGIGRSSQEADAFHQIHTKRLKTTEWVTAVGFSSAPGYAIVKGITSSGGGYYYDQRSQIDYNLP
jgi:hypothetical protein